VAAAGEGSRGAGAEASTHGAQPGARARDLSARPPPHTSDARLASAAQPFGIRNTWMDWSFRAQRALCRDFLRSDTAISVSSVSQAIPSTLR